MSTHQPLIRYDSVTPEWLTQALRATWPEITVRTVKRGPVFGYKKNKFRVEVEYADAASDYPRTFIVKGNFPGENDPSTGTAWAMATELRSIRDVAPLIATPAMPAWYDISIDAEAASIVMEDLTPKGVVFFNAFKTLDVGQAMAFVDAFARMHASSWNSPAFQPGGVMGPGTFAWDNRVAVNDTYFPTFFKPENWSAYVDLPRGRALPNAFQDLARAEKAWYRLWALLRQSAMVIVHGDEHLGNLYVTADGTPGVLDWVARPEYWPIGFAYFVLCALDAMDRRRWEAALLSHYLSRLEVYGARPVPSWEEAWFFYRCATLYPTITWLNNSAVWQPESINTANAVRAATAAMDHDAFGLLGV
jgi:hypothetical protein